MNSRQQRVLASYRRIVNEFKLLMKVPSPEVREIHGRFVSTVAELSTVAQRQHNTRFAFPLTRVRRGLERLRTEVMLPLARVSRRHFRGEESVLQALRVPHKRAANEDILASALGMVKTLRPHKKLLSAARIDVGRIDKLDSEAKRIRKELKEAYAKSADRAAPTRQLPALFSDAHEDVMALDSIVRAEGTRTQIAGWKHMKRVQKRMGRPKARTQRASTEPARA